MLKSLLLRKRIDDKKKELDSLRSSVDFDRRSAEIEEHINSVNTEEERSNVEAEIDAFESEKAEHNAKCERLQSEIDSLEQELADAENDPAPENEPVNERKVNKTMINRSKFFGLSMTERDAFLATEEVKDFLARARELGKEKRSVSGADLLIPTSVLDIIRENIGEYSKLYKHVRVVSVSGKARQPIAGTLPEGVWTEMCAALNELSFGFGAWDVDGYKVGGYIAICNAVLADSDVALATEIINALSYAIGMALDKAILYGTGTKMPKGILTRLGETSQPENYPVNAPAWVDLHTSNIKVIASGTTGVNLYKDVVSDFANAKGRYSGSGNKFWAMNEATYAAIVAEAMSVNAAGSIVAGVNKEMPVLGGAIETLSWMPDNVIIAGYGDLYLLAERDGASVSSSEHYRFVEDQTVFKGTARYDGVPAVPNGFVAIGINSTTPSASAVTFATDYANTLLGDLAVTAAAGGTTGKTVLTVTGTEQSGTTLAYKVGNFAVKSGEAFGGTALTSGTTQIACSAGAWITVAELDAAGKAIKAGWVIGVPKAA